MRWTRLSTWLVMLALPACLLVLSGCSGGTDAPPAAAMSASDSSSNQIDQEDPEMRPLGGVVQVRADGPSSETPARLSVPPATKPEVLIETNLGQIRLRLFPEQAPMTVENFLNNYVQRGFYDDTLIHFVAPDFLIAAGGFRTDLQPIEPRAYIASEADNGLKNVRGTVAMSRDAEHMDSANCQFFINVADNPGLDHQSRDDAASFGYCVFGEVIEGMDVVDRISQVATVDQENFPSTPQEPVVIQSIHRLR
jgi:peptidyl-prolyl cis-trans isomerase A (cyclophilin A)